MKTPAFIYGSLLIFLLAAFSTGCAPQPQTVIVQRTPRVIVVKKRRPPVVVVHPHRPHPYYHRHNGRVVIRH